MPKEKPFYVNTPRLLRRRSLDMLMFGYVVAYRYSNALCVFTVKSAIEKFKDDFNLSEDDYPVNVGVTQFYKLFNEYKEYRHEC